MSKVKPGAGRKMWIKALRSGKYKQARRTLLDPKRNSYCCLGVACDVFSKAKSRGGEFADNGLRFEIGNDSGAGFLVNKQVAAWVGVTQAQVSDLVDMNDAKLASFDRIADYLEALPA